MCAGIHRVPSDSAHGTTATLVGGPEEPDLKARATTLAVPAGNVVLDWLAGSATIAGRDAAVGG
jgi:hypothetical protein